MKKLSIFASGGGSNAEKIFEYFQGNKEVKIDTVIVSNKNAGILQKCKDWGCEIIVLNKETFYNSNEIVDLLKSRETDLIILAGFLWLVPDNLVAAFPNTIVNIHPALLPKFGGKGMYGMNVHKAVAAAKEKESGITIHYINNEYDKGDVIFQTSCKVENLSAEEIAKEVLKLEHQNFPKVIEQILTQ